MIDVIFFKKTTTNLQSWFSDYSMSTLNCILSVVNFFQCRKRRLKVSIIGVPKTIDNDILLMDKTFGFDTAVEEAQRAINSAYIEVNILLLKSI